MYSCTPVPYLYPLAAGTKTMVKTKLQMAQWVLEGMKKSIFALLAPVHPFFAPFSFTCSCMPPKSNDCTRMMALFYWLSL
jgi:uncharacterized Zn finger protein